MPNTENYLAFDLGAESGRAILGRWQGEQVRLEELHRFANPAIRVLGSLRWDALHLFNELKTGLGKAAARKPVSLGVDTWGVDFALLDRDGDLIGSPYHYRDTRTRGVMAKAFEIVPRREIFSSTGLQFMDINSLYQLLAMKGTAALDSARTLLMMPDLFHYWFTGEQTSEFTDATTTQFYDPREKNWALPLLSRFGLPVDIYPRVIEPGTRIGELLHGVRQECNAGPTHVVAPASHDTGSAVAAIPASGERWAFVSSGTWSLLGREMQKPFVNDTVLERNFTNEGGAWGTTRLLKNICGMWLLEECRREWSKQGHETDYDELCASARAEEAFRSLIDVDDPIFVVPGGMPQRIAEVCKNTGQPVPATPPQMARCIFESLALKYRLVLDDLEAITGESIEALHIVGGGSKNALLCQYAADAAGVKAVAGPVEATALGNVLVQAMAAGRIENRNQAREIVRRSVALSTYEPRPDRHRWDDALGRLREMTAVGRQVRP